MREGGHTSAACLDLPDYPRLGQRLAAGQLFALKEPQESRAHFFCPAVSEMTDSAVVVEQGFAGRTSFLVL